MNWLIDAMLVGTIACILLSIYYTHQATKHCKRAAVLWKQAEDNWREAARLRGLK